MPSFFQKVLNAGYHADCDGNVWSPTGKLIKLNCHKKYWYFIWNRKHVYVHRLQAYQLFGEWIYEEGIVVRHKDDNQDDNTWDNILIGTPSDNRQDIPLELRRKYGSGKKSRELHTKIFQALDDGKSHSQIKLEFELSNSHLRYILNDSYTAKQRTKESKPL